MDLRQLRYFVTVAEVRNFNRAAEVLAMAQPPLSRSIHQLEAEMGSVLLDRTSRPLKLTPMGRLFYDQALQVLGRVEDMRTMMKSAAGSERRRFTIGFVASTIYARLPALIREFRNTCPDVELVLVESGTLDQIAALKDGRIDVGFGRIRMEDPALRRIVLRDERLIVALPLSHHLAQQEGPVSLSEVGREPQIVYPRAPRPSYADQVISLLRDRSIEPRIVHEARELQTAIGLVAAEEGVAIVPESVRRSRTEDVRYRELIENATSPIIMSQRKGDVTPELAIMGQVIAKQYKEWGYEVPDALR
ncbi:LysR family transcriptional regulator [Sphingobium chungbukense]|uniref:LysR family transcriptional regulator n=1 Tax=Sphingobium chungbukense TaxID=56193 RepID=A0A0M3ANK8_9SPHN|nr:LysR family transcriptional regulator [Sphingobium chungbukense]KKW90124.1 LysR family transcriptional regulator [Sphingobium chungbukense]